MDGEQAEEPGSEKKTEAEQLSDRLSRVEKERDSFIEAVSKLEPLPAGAEPGPRDYPTDPRSGDFCPSYLKPEIDPSHLGGYKLKKAFDKGRFD